MTGPWKTCDRSWPGAGPLAATPPSSAGANPDHVPTPDPPPAPARHVLAQDSTGTWVPALLLGWHRHGTTWWGRVAMLEHGEAAVVDLVDGRLKPATCDCCGTR